MGEAIHPLLHTSSYGGV